VFLDHLSTCNRQLLTAQPSHRLRLFGDVGILTIFGPTFVTGQTAPRRSLDEAQEATAGPAYDNDWALPSTNVPAYGGPSSRCARSPQRLAIIARCRCRQKTWETVEYSDCSSADPVRDIAHLFRVSECVCWQRGPIACHQNIGSTTLL